MSEMVDINIIMDSSVIKAMEEVCEQLGLSLTDAFTIYAKKVVREKRIPLKIVLDPLYDENNIRQLEKKYEDDKNGR